MNQIKVKASVLLGDTLDNCSNLTLFFINGIKVIGTASFHKFGCNINIIDYVSKDEDFNLMINSGLYDIFGSLNNLKLTDFNETTIIDEKLLPKAISFVKNHNIYCEEYKEDFMDIEIGDNNGNFFKI